jgi:serine/threonine-protein kinase
MAPEHARGMATDARSDIYAVGVMLFEMLTGKPPFWADSPMELLKLHVFQEAPVVKLRHGKLPRVVEACVMKMLRKKPEDRQADCGVLVAELDRCIAAARS